MTESTIRPPPIELSELPDEDVQPARDIWKKFVKDTIDKEFEFHAFTARVSHAWEEAKSQAPGYVGAKLMEKCRKT